MCFFSRQLRGGEKNYSMMESRLLGVIEAVDHWAHYLYGQNFEVVTGHKALCSLMSSQHLNKRLRGFALRDCPRIPSVFFTGLGAVMPMLMNYPDRPGSQRES